jgi:hypothetical protein
MKITLDNYEAFFLDYFEGNLSPDEKEDVQEFIRQNPATRDQFEEFECVYLTPDASIQYTNKSQLLKSLPSHGIVVTLENIEEVLISEREGLLDNAEIKALELFISDHPEFARDRELFGLTQVIPDQSIVFSSKDQLKHQAIPSGSINESNFTEKMIAQLEGELNQKELAELEEFLNLNPHLQNDRKIIGLTKLQAETTIIYPDKAKLLKSVVPIRRIVYYALSAAASLTILFGAYRIIVRPDQNQGIAQFPTTQETDRSIKTIGDQKKAETEKPSPEPTVISTADDAVQLAKAKEENQLTESSEQNDYLRTELAAVTPRLSTQVISQDHVAPEFIFIRTSQMHSNEFIELYYNVKLAEQIQYAQLNEKDKNPGKTIFTSISSKVSGLFAQNRRTSIEPTSNLTIWTFAELGVKTYNSITKDNIALDLERDETGKVISYNITGDKLDLQRDVK